MDPEAKKIIQQLEKMKEQGQEPSKIVQAFNTWKTENSNVTDFSGLQLEGYDIPGIDFQNLDFGSNASFRKCNLSEAIFASATLIKARIIDCTLKNAKFNGATLSESVFQCDHTSFPADGCSFMKSVAIATTFNAKLEGSKFREATLEEAKFDGSNLRHSDFRTASLKGASLRATIVNTDTRFQHLSAVEGCLIDRYVLYCLDNDFGGLTVGNRMDMIVINDVALLRSQFSGIWMWGHLLSLGAFLFPYAWFVVEHWAIASFKKNGVQEQTIALWEALLRFIVSGGEEWRTRWQLSWWFLVFIAYAIYNFCRGHLLWKTKQLETKEITSELPVRFSLLEATYWRRLLAITRWGFWGALILIALNTIHFLQMRIPVD